MQWFSLSSSSAQLLGGGSRLSTADQLLSFWYETEKLHWWVFIIVLRWWLRVSTGKIIFNRCLLFLNLCHCGKDGSEQGNLSQNCLVLLVGRVWISSWIQTGAHEFVVANCCDDASVSTNNLAIGNVQVCATKSSKVVKISGHAVAVSGGRKWENHQCGRGDVLNPCCALRSDYGLEVESGRIKDWSA